MDNDQNDELVLSKTHFDAIKLLEGALHKMDGIISLEPSSCSKLSINSNIQTVLQNYIQQKNNDPSGHLESFKLQVSVLNDQVDVLLRKLSHLEKYLSQQSELRQKAENRLQEELILKSKLETEKLEVIAMLTNLKLVNVRLAKENMELKEKVINNKNTASAEESPGTPDITNSQFHRSKYHGSRFYCSLPRHMVSKKKSEIKNLNTETLNDITESCVNLINRRSSQFDKCSSAPNLVDSKNDYQNEQLLENNSSLFSSTKINTFPNSNLPFGEWTRQQVFDWFAEQGIHYILQESKIWPNSGKELISASISDIDDKFKFKHCLHRKKLILALLCEREQNKLFDEDRYLSKTRYLNTAWVLQWLDDIGLPQYKDPFSQAAINGALLHRLTKDEFLMMQNGNSDLHFSSLRCGIKVLRNNNFDPECLIRRSNINKNEVDYDLSLWTTHRVMEWLCSVNLAEYASNLRGSGVHGGLIVYEDRFTSDLLADILFIQQSKTLLRRHLSIQFGQLLKKDLNKKKRDAQGKSKYRPLTISSKIKIQKKSQFSLKRKKNNELLAIGDLICPIED